MRALVLPVFVLSACGPCPPVEDIVVDGTSEEVGIVEQALSDLQRWTDRRSFCVAEVVVTPDLPEGNEGRYDGPSGQILLRRGQDELYGTAVHESCHGIDKATALASRNRDAFPYDPALPDYDLRDERSRAREAMAKTCESGPVNLHATVAAAEACDSTVFTDSAALVLDRVFATWPAPADEPAVATPVASWSVPATVGVVVPVQAAFVGDELLVAVVRAEGFGVAHLEPDTGALHEITAGDLPAPPSWPGDPLPWSWTDTSVATWADGSALIAYREVMANGDIVFGVAGWDGEWTLPAAPCSSEGAGLVTVRGEPWLVEAEVGEVRWARWARP